MGLLSWLHIEQHKPQIDKYDWEVIGSESPVVGSEHTENVPSWVLRAYEKCHIHHDGVAYNFNGKHYQYKVVESGQGGGYHTFYRRLRNH
jgi:hypothetical protein